MRVVIFGAGGVGIGFMGDLLHRSGAELVFVEVNHALAESLNHYGSYTINKANLETVTQFTVDNLVALDPSQEESAPRLAEELTVADFAITAVGARVLPRIGQLLAKITEQFSPRQQPLDLLCCENHHDAAGLLRESVVAKLGAEPADQRFGFVNTVVGRMCQNFTRSERDLPPVTPDLDTVILVEDYDPFPIDRGALRGPVPPMACLEAVETARFRAYEHRKLYGHNGVHALLAVLGKLRGYEFFYQAGADATLDRIGRWAMWEEVGAALVKAYPQCFTAENLDAFAQDLYDRLVNPAFGDMIERGARDTRRMIRPEDGRLSGAALFVAEQGLSPRAMSLGVAAALRDNGLGPEGLQETLALASPAAVETVRHLVDSALQAVDAEATGDKGALSEFVQGT